MEKKWSLRSYIPTAEISRFASEKFKASAICPRCGVNDWQYTDESLTREVLGIGILDANNNPTGLYATLIFECKNCGFIAPHAKSVVVNWLNDHEQ